MNEVLNVYLASPDDSKAFDRVNHFQLYQSLMKRNVPVTFLNFIIYWYSKLTVMVRWNFALCAIDNKLQTLIYKGL